MTIKPLHLVSHEEIADMARNAAENGEPQHVANVFEPGTSQHHHFSHCYWERHRELAEAEA